MTTNSNNQDNFDDQDAALTAAEREVWGPFVDATHEIAPRPEFAAQLEARLLAAAEPLVMVQPEPVKQADAPILTRPQPRPFSNMLSSGRKLFQLPQARYASVGLALGLVMVAVLVGMAAMYNMRKDTRSANQTPGPASVNTSLNPSVASGSSEDLLKWVAEMRPLQTLDAGGGDSATQFPIGLDILMAWSPDGRTLATAEVTNSEQPGDTQGAQPPDMTYVLKLWNTQTGNLLSQSTLVNLDNLSWSADNNTLAVSLKDGTVKLLDRSANLLSVLQVSTFAGESDALSEVFSITWSPHGDMLATAARDPYSPTDRDGIIRLWDPTKGALVRSIRVVHNDNDSSYPWVSKVEWSPDGLMLAAMCEDGVLRLYDPQTGALRHELSKIRETPDYRPSYFAWSPDGRTLAVGAGRFVDLWDAATGKFERSMPEALPPTALPTVPPRVPDTPQVREIPPDMDPSLIYTELYDIKWSPDGHTLATVADVGRLKLWDVASGQKLKVPTLSREYSVNWVISPNWRLVASLEHWIPSAQYPDQTLNLWDLSTGKELRTLVKGDALGAVWSPDGSMLAISTNEGVTLWGSPAVAAEESTPVAEPANNFVPAGKVRHLVITHETSAADQKTITWTEDVWLSNGQNHTIMRKTGIMPGLTTLIDDNTVWTYGPQFGNTVYKTAYDKKHFAEFIHDKQIIDEMLKQPNTHYIPTIGGDDTLDGHPVMVLESLNNTPADVQITNADKPVVEFASFSDGIPVVIHPATASAGPGATPTITLSGSPTDGGNEVLDHRLWIDSDTYQILQQRYNNRFIKPQPDSKVVTYMRKITLDEVKDASAFPADLFTFKLPYGATIVDAYQVFVPRIPANLDMAGAPTPAPTPAAKLTDLPADKVRHLVYAETTTLTGEAAKTGTTEVWLVNGLNHSLMRVLYSLDNARQWLDEDAFYYENSYGKTIYKQTYNPEALSFYVPNQQVITNTIQSPGGRLLGTETIDGHTVLVIEAVSEKPKDIPPPSKSSAEHPYTDIKLWIDTSTFQSLKRQVTISYIGGPKSGSTTTYLTVLKTDELQDRSEFAPDFFQFRLPEGYTLDTQQYVSAVSTVLPVPTVSAPDQATRTPDDTTSPPRMPLAEFKALYDNPAKRPLIIDVRAKEAYDAGHIKGAESWPASDIDAIVVKLPNITTTH